jgi:hypothetical protein
MLDHDLRRSAKLAAIPAAALLGLLSFFGSSSRGAQPDTCSTAFAKDFFKVCFYSGTAPGVGQVLGSQSEATLPSPAPTRAYGIDRDWGSGPVFAGITDDISGVWRGKFFFDGGSYLFTIFGDDGVRVFVDDQVQPVLEKWQDGFATYAVARQMDRRYHNIRVEWYERGGAAQLRFHWDKAPPAPAGAKVSPVVLDAFVVKRQDVCVAGNPYSSGEPFSVFNPDGTIARRSDGTALQWQQDAALTFLQPSDERRVGYSLVECFSFGFTDGEVAAIRNNFTAWEQDIANWSLGAIAPTANVELLEGEILLTRSDWGAYLSAADIAARAKPLVTQDADLTVGLFSIRDISGGPNDGRYVLYRFGGVAFGPGRDLGGLWGAPYAFATNSEGAIVHEVAHLTRMMLDFIMGPEDYPLYPPYPPACFTDAERAAADTFLWFPDADYYIDSVPGDPQSPDLAGEDPDFPWCRSTTLPAVFPQAAHNLLWHFDPSLAHYRLDYLTGNHCNDLRQDFGETGVDTGAGICPGLPPAIAISNPANGSVVSGNTTVTASTSTVSGRNYEARLVEFYIDGELVETDTVHPFDHFWDTHALPEGSSHIVSVRAVDWSDLSSSASATVTVGNVDSDGDGFLDGDESYMGTDPNWECPATTAGDDETVDSWPPDFNDDTFVDILDVSRMAAQRFGSGRGDPDYDPRYDLNGDGFIDITDYGAVNGRFGQHCTRRDTDGDGFFDSAERSMGTDPARACPQTGATDDEPVDAWPPDFNDDRYVDGTDLTRMAAQRFGANRGDPDYDPRYDLDANGFIDISDIANVSNRFGQGCQ